MSAESAVRPAPGAHRTRRRRSRGRPAWQLALAGLALFGVTAGTIYFFSTRHTAVAPPAPAAAGSAPGAETAARALSPDRVQRMIDEVTLRVQKDPKDSSAWALLAHSYDMLGKFDESSKAYAKLVELMPGNAQVLADYADALAVSKGRSFKGEPEQLLKRALAADPKNLKALLLAGTDAFDRQAYGDAIGFWERARAVSTDAAVTRQIDSGLAEARVLGSRTERVGAGHGFPQAGRDDRRRRPRGVGPRQPVGRTAGQSLARRHGVHLRALDAGFAHAGGAAAQEGARPAAGLPARRQHGDGAGDQALGVVGGGGRRTRFQAWRCDAAHRGPAGPVEPRGRRVARRPDSDHRGVAVMAKPALLRSIAGSCLLAATLLGPRPALAVLGERLPAAATGASQAKGASAMRRTLALSSGVQVYERASGDGGVIREYVSADGVVFAVSWNTRFKPRLNELLGRYHEGYAAAASEALKRPGIQRQSVLRAQDLVVRSTSHLNVFSGRAFVPSLVPAGFDAALAR